MNSRSFVRTALSLSLLTLLLGPRAVMAASGPDATQCSDPLDISYLRTLTSDTDIESTQRELDRVGEELGPLEFEGAHPGLLSIDMFQRTQTLRVWWNGPETDRLRGIAARASGRGITVLICASPYSAARLREASRVISHTVTGYQLTDVGPTPNGAAISISGRDLSKDQVQQARLLHLLSKYDDGIPLIIGRDVSPQASYRKSDTPGYYGGGRLYVDQTNGCSSGFTYNGNGVPAGATLMLTAAHCADYANDKTFEQGEHSRIGISRWTNRLWSTWDLDATMIRFDKSKYGSARIFDGGVEDATEFSKPVSGLGTIVNGELIFSSGSYSGIRDHIYFTGMDHSVYYFSTGHWQWVRSVVNDGVFSQHSVWGYGDSGGPLFKIDPQIQYKVYALGITSGLDPFYDYATCYREATSCSGEGWATRLAMVSYAAPELSIKTS